MTPAQIKEYVESKGPATIVKYRDGRGQAPKFDFREIRSPSDLDGYLMDDDVWVMLPPPHVDISPALPPQDSLSLGGAARHLCGETSSRLATQRPILRAYTTLSHSIVLAIDRRWYLFNPETRTIFPFYGTPDLAGIIPFPDFSQFDFRIAFYNTDQRAKMEAIQARIRELFPRQ